jgi:multiple sugar transport system permease protein
MAVQAKKITKAPAWSPTSYLSRAQRNLILTGLISMGTILILLVYLAPFGYAVGTALRDPDIGTERSAPIWPAMPNTYTHEGKELPLYAVPMPDGTTPELALLKPGRKTSLFIDPSNGQQIEWTGFYRGLDRTWKFAPQWKHFSEAFVKVDFALLFRNTIAIALIGMVGTLISSILVAYGFSRFPVPYKGVLFMILIGTIILPPQVTQVPTFTLFTKIGWVNTWLPLIVPHFFANAYNVFLLRQFFMTIPREMDEAAMIDGASPARTLWSIILPQSVPVIIAVAMFHFFFAWNDFFGPLIYLTDRKDLQPISVGMKRFLSQYSGYYHWIQATALMAMALPVLIFLVAQKFFMQGVVTTGVDK